MSLIELIVEFHHLPAVEQRCQHVYGIEPHGRVIIPTGIAISLPVGYEAQIRGRSGMAAKFGITLANGVGTIDADYRGEIGVILLNTSDQSFVVEPGMRIAQMVVTSYERVEWNEIGQLDETERGSGGYGSTEIGRAHV